MAGKTWTKAEQKRLATLKRQGHGYVAIAADLGRTVDAVRSHSYSIGLGPAPHRLWWDGLTIGFLDIETSNREANAGPMMSWAIKVRGVKKVLSDCVTPEELQSLKFDRRICYSLSKAMHGLDIVVTYWGTYFDIPFARTRFIANNLEFPKVGELYHWDLFFPARRLLRLHRRSLDALCAFLGIEGKTHLDMAVWMKARAGHRKSLKYVLDHNIGDVEILELAWDKLKDYQKWQRKSV